MTLSADRRRSMRLIDADVLIPQIREEKIEGEILGIIKALGDGLQAETLNQACDRHIKIISSLPTIDAVPVVRCKDCKYRPTDTGSHGYGQDLEFANDYKCPCQCDDCWYSWMPEDDWFCANGERRE